ncbi:hypothetical protein DLM78_11185 [Leptospira stimsonii]|uniref:Uncharacterized protein n=1 Tax=Leptospira stimsonii TaxID=2202203 RepID=A0A8B3CRJ8_9LEPT|nr:hypothetical protein DLM78_11185 [Leptospira stimsonii]
MFSHINPYRFKGRSSENIPKFLTIYAFLIIFAYFLGERDRLFMRLLSTIVREVLSLLKESKFLLRKKRDF